MSKMTIGSKIAFARKKRRYSQKQLAEFISVNTQQISHWETGFRNPSEKNLDSISKVLEIKEGYFSDFDDNIDPNSFFLPLKKDIDSVVISDFRLPTRDDYLIFIITYAKRLSDEQLADLFEYEMHLLKSAEEHPSK